MQLLNKHRKRYHTVVAECHIVDMTIAYSNASKVRVLLINDVYVNGKDG